MLRFKSLLFLFGLFYYGDSLPPVYDTEICDNAIDDDGDGLIDFQDGDCTCEFIEIRSLIPNPSFEERSCCPDSHYRLDCARPWIQAYGTTPDYVHTCGWTGQEGRSVPLPIPDGDAAIGFLNGKVPGDLPVEYDWKEYAGVCLKSTMKAGISYRIDFHMGFVGSITSPPMELVIYGTDDCDNFPFGANVVLPGCPTNFPEWVRLAGKMMDGGQDPKWISDSLVFTPDRDIKAIAIGPPCEPFEGLVSNYYYLDNLIMEESFLFQYQVIAEGDPCDDDMTLSVATSAALAYQWYKDSIALLGETGPDLQLVYGDGNYQVRMIEPDGCRMSPPYSYVKPIVKETRVEETICEGTQYLDGDFSASAPGNYQYSLPTSSGCDSLILLSLLPCQIFVPDAFSPNGDGINDVFQVFGKENTDNYTIQVFNRWGSLLFQGQAWDGITKGIPAPMGDYFYVVNQSTDSGDQVIKKGTFTLMR